MDAAAEIMRDPAYRRLMSSGAQNGRMACPECSAGRKKSNDPTLSFSIREDRLIWNCWHCGTTGSHWLTERRSDRPVPKKRTLYIGSVIAPEHVKWFAESRGIGIDALRHFRVFSRQMWIGRAQRETWCVGFPYQNGVKYRAIAEKGFTQEGIADTFLNIEHVDPTEPMVITEGEIDALAGWHSGVTNIVSVPSGAVATVASDGKVDPKEDGKFRYVWAAQEKINACRKIVIAADNDDPGKALGEELARRIGRAKCWRVRYPEGCKDINDILLQHGEDGVRLAVEHAEPWPVNGLYSAAHYGDQVIDLYRNGFGETVSTGWSSVDELFRIGTGQIAIVTGSPNSGKSAFVDAMLVNLAQIKGWKTAMCSFENPPRMHIPKLIELHLRKPFFSGPTTRMREDQVMAGMAWVNEHFAFIDQQDGQSATIDSILEKAKAAVQRIGARILVIDPYNYIDRETLEDSETNFISDMLTKVRNFAQAHDVFVAFVAHPAKLLRIGKEYPVPKGYDISGSAAWFSKADIGLTVHRPDPKKPRTEIHVWKVRWKWFGKQGQTELEYDVATGVYREVFDDPWSGVVGPRDAGDQPETGDERRADV